MSYKIRDSKIKTHVRNSSEVRGYKNDRGLYNYDLLLRFSFYDKLGIPKESSIKYFLEMAEVNATEAGEKPIWIDFCCGTGDVLREHMQDSDPLNFQYVGIDFQMHEMEPPISFVRADLDRITSEEIKEIAPSLYFATCIEGLQYTKHVKENIEKVYQSLVMGGIFVFTAMWGSKSMTRGQWHRSAFTYLPRNFGKEMMRNISKMPKSFEYYKEQSEFNHGEVMTFAKKGDWFCFVVIKETERFWQ
ncbi:class I SAM-dependent methyltransferase [Candidatus Micrarchaeota archaeon]|nr:class I SAM-dependent methyltransferase [Candidatus Micrarchaeota archaeon]